MKGNISLATLCIVGLNSLAFADSGYSSSQTQPNGGYYSTQTQANTSGYSSTQSSSRGETYYSGYTTEQPVYRSKNKYYSSRNRTGHPFFEEAGPHWVDSLKGYPLPSNAVPGGVESYSNTLYVCRASYQNGMHPGKLIAGDCNISWGGSEVRLARYQILVSQGGKYAWVPAYYGALPAKALSGGSENGRPLYICQASWQGGVHPGKVVGSRCNFGYGGREISVSAYNVLVYA